MESKQPELETQPSAAAASSTATKESPSSFRGCSDLFPSKRKPTATNQFVQS